MNGTGGTGNGLSWWKVLIIRNFDKLGLILIGVFGVSVGVYIAMHKLDEKYVLMIIGIGSSAVTAFITLVNNAMQQKRQTDSTTEERSSPEGDTLKKTTKTEVTDGPVIVPRADEMPKPDDEQKP